MKVIGITGGIGSGKSKVLNYMEQNLDAQILQTDLVAHMLQEPGKSCYKKIVETFGSDILLESGWIDRKKLGSIVFADDEKRKQLNQIIHPEVKAFVKCEIEHAKKNQVKFFVIESALLKEDHYEKICDEIWYIYANQDSRVQRLRESRGLPIEKIKNIMEAQASEEVFREYCDVFIDNSKEFACTIKQIEQAIEEIDRRSQYETL